MVPVDRRYRKTGGMPALENATVEPVILTRLNAMNSLPSRIPLIVALQ